MNEERCPECKKENSLFTKQHDGNIVCKNCGVVNESRIIDQSYEKR
jgi:transcription initiation factor TFIIIB Brf1 subunit/transcription initiation factor TFIIB